MTKQHFIRLADYIKRNRADFSDGAIGVIADFCRSENPAFRRETFIGYIQGTCGPTPPRSRRVRTAFTMPPPPPKREPGFVVRFKTKEAAA